MHPLIMEDVARAIMADRERANRALRPVARRPPTRLRRAAAVVLGNLALWRR
jgi:hypothetical protein